MGLTPSDTAGAIALIQDRQSKYYVARVLGVSRCSIQRAVNRFPETKGYTRRVGSGRKRSTTDHDDHFLTLTILRNRDTTAVRARNELQEVRSVAVSERTVRKRLEEHGLSARTLAHCLLLTREHRVARLLIAHEHRNWGIEEWGRILFTDESGCCLRSPDGRQRVWRSTGQGVAQCNFVPGISFGSGSIMAWGGISMEARTELVVVNGGQ
jgi:transposase